MLRVTVDLAAILWAGLILPCLADTWVPDTSDGDEAGPDGILGPFNWSQVGEITAAGYALDYFQEFNFNNSSLETAWASPFASTTYTKTGTPGYNLTIAVTSVPGEALNTGFGALSHPNTWGSWPMAVASIKGPDLNLSYACLTMLMYSNVTWQDHAQGDDGSCQTALSAECLEAVQNTASANTSISNCDERAISFLDPCQMDNYIMNPGKCRGNCRSLLVPALDTFISNPRLKSNSNTLQFTLGPKIKPY
jgi:hypothetical protein